MNIKDRDVVAQIVRSHLSANDRAKQDREHIRAVSAVGYMWLRAPVWNGERLTVVAIRVEEGEMTAEAIEGLREYVNILADHWTQKASRAALSTEPRSADKRNELQADPAHPEESNK